MTEADACREFITPKLVEAGWGVAESVIGEQHSFTNGRIIVTGGKVRRGKQRRADYLLCYRRNIAATGSSRRHPMALLRCRSGTRSDRSGSAAQ
jgi:type I site-specific restriction endonuclease